MKIIDYNYDFPITVDGQVYVLLPVELLWVEDYKVFGKSIENETEQWRRSNAKWAGKSLLRLRPHIDLFNFLAHGEPSVSSYAQWYRDDVFASRAMDPPLDDAQLLDYRYRSVQIFSQELERLGVHSDLMRIKAKYDATKNIFLIEDGHHRSCYMLTRGYRRIPASVSYEDFNTWVNLSYSFHVNEIIERQGRDLNYTPVLVPMVRPMNVVRDTTYKSRLDHLMYFLGERILEGPLLDIGSNTGFFSFHFMREGLKVVGCEPDQNHLDLARCLGDTYRLPHNFTSQPVADYLANDVSFNGCLLLTVLYHLIAVEEHIEVLRLIDEKVLNYIIWESGPNPELEKQLISTKTKFRNYQLIARTYATGKVREFGIFFRDDWEI